MQVRITGGADLADVRAALRRVNDKALAKQMSAALRKAARPLTPEIRKESGRLLPSGYAPVLSRSLRTRMSTRERAGVARVELRVYADGTKERRDLPRLNRGELRHPVFGRSRRLKSGRRVRNPWAVQRVRAGVVDRPVDRLRPEVARQMQAVIDAVAEQIIRGR